MKSSNGLQRSPRTSALDELGDQMAKAGTRPWAIYFVGRAKKARYDFESDAKSLRELLDDLEEGEAWKPLGLASFDMLCELMVGLSPEQMDAIRSANPGATIKAVLGKHGGDRKSEAVKDQDSKSTSIGRSSDYRLARIARDHPEINVQDFPSVRQAALKAGIVEPSFQCPKDPTKAAKRLRRHFDGERLTQLVDLLSR